MMKSIAVEHARYGVRANSILPGWIATDMTQGAQDNPAFAEKVIPACRCGAGASRRISAASLLI